MTLKPVNAAQATGHGQRFWTPAVTRHVVGAKPNRDKRACCSTFTHETQRLASDDWLRTTSLSIFGRGAPQKGLGLPGQRSQSQK